MMAYYTKTNNTINTVYNDYLHIETSLDQYKLYWKSLNEQRQDGLLCDAVIQCRGTTYPAHKCVLASASPYFKALFTSPFCISSNIQVAKLDQFSEKSIALLLDVIYGHVNIETSNVAEMLRLADFLQYDWLLNQLVESIRVTLDESNCFSWYEIAKMGGIDKLSLLAESYIRINYEKLLAMDEYRHLALSIERDCFFDKEIVFYCSYKSFYVIDEQKRSCVKYKNGPCCVSDIQPVLDHMNALQDFDIVSCFAYKKELYVVTCFEDSIPALSSGETNIEIYTYKQLYERYSLVYRLKQFDILYDKHLFREYVKSDDLASWRAEHGGFVLQQAIYDNRHSVYFLFASNKVDEVVIKKFSLLQGCWAENYIRLHVQVDETKFQFVECNELGFILVLGLELVYRLEDFDFRNRECSDVCELNIKPNKESIFYEPVNGMWNCVSLRGEVYYFGLFHIADTTHTAKLCVLKLNTTTLSWDHLNEYDVAGCLTNAFYCQGKLFVVLSSNKYGDEYCCCSDKVCELAHYKPEEVFETVFHYDPDMDSLSPTTMQLPNSEFKHYRAFTVPAHVLM